jgi:uncharacterized repeat protein (TIGR01451 family)
VGANNRFFPREDRGQTTNFLPGHHENAFTVPNIPSRLLVRWLVTHGGATRVATPHSAFPTKCAGPPPADQPLGLSACVVDHGNTYDAVFGYVNDNPVDISVPLGLANNMVPAPHDRGQPTLFNPGRHDSAFTVHGVPAGTLLAWNLSFQGTRSVVVTSSYPIKCAVAPAPLPVVVFPLCVRRTGGSYTAVFGYVNPNQSDVYVPVGAANRTSPAPPVDRGQPVVFRPGVSWAAFAVRGTPLARDVSWTVETSNEAHSASASVDLARKCPTTPVDPDVDLALDKSVKPATVVVGDRIEYTIVVRNKGTTTAQSVTVVDQPLDGRVQLLSATSSQGRCRVRGERVVCGLGELAPGESARIVVAARTVEPGRSQDRAVVASLPPDSGEDNVDTATVSIRAAGPAARPHGVRRPPFTG